MFAFSAALYVKHRQNGTMFGKNGSVPHRMLATNKRKTNTRTCRLQIHTVKVHCECLGNVCGTLFLLEHLIPASFFAMGMSWKCVPGHCSFWSISYQLYVFSKTDLDGTFLISNGSANLLALQDCHMPLLNWMVASMPCIFSEGRCGCQESFSARHHLQAMESKGFQEM